MKIWDLDFETTAELNDDIFTIKGGSEPNMLEQNLTSVPFTIVCTMYLLPSGVIECRCEESSRN